MPASRRRQPKTHEPELDIKIGLIGDTDETLTHTFIAIDVDAIGRIEENTPGGQKTTRPTVGSWVSGWTKPADDTDYSKMERNSIDKRSDFLMDSCYSKKIFSLARTLRDAIGTEEFKDDFANQSKENQETWLKSRFAEIANTDKMKDQPYTIRVTDAADRATLVARKYLHFEGRCSKS